jgi:T5SS/PEP-CTERM-associated repeat protein/autotransporter-associated beta strand protein
VPGSSNFAQINLGSGNMPVVSSGTAQISSLILGLDANSSANTSLTVQSGATLTVNDGLIGDQSGSNGTLTVTGTGSQLIHGLSVGAGGVGYLNILNGASMTGGVDVGVLSGSQGTIVVDGAGSRLNANSLGMTIGDQGQGTMNVTNGGNVTSTNSTLLVGADHGQGAALLDGAGSSLSVASIVMGNVGSGNLTVQNGGLVTGGNMILTGQPTDSATVNLNPGGTLRLTGNNMTTIDGANGAVNFNLNGGTLQFLGANETVDEPITFAANTSTVDTGPNHVLVDWKVLGAGNFTKTGTGTLLLTYPNTFAGVAIINAGTLALSGSGSLGAGSAVTLAGGTLDISGLNSSFYAVGTALTGNGTVNTGGKTLSLSGLLSPGIGAGATGLISVTSAGGGVSLSGNAIFDVNGSAAYDQLMATGSLGYGGNLTLNFGSPLLAGTFPLFTFGSESGDLAAVTISGAYIDSLADSGGVWTGQVGGINFSFSTGTGTLTVVPEPGVLAFVVGLAAGLATWGRRRLGRLRRLLV